MNFFVIILQVILVCGFTISEDILAVIPSPFFSHQATFRPIWRELAKRGHKITLITTDIMEENENITQIDYSGTYEHFKSLGLKDMIVNKFQVTEIYRTVKKALNTYIEYQFSHPGLKNLIQNNATFDVIFIETAMPNFAFLSRTFKAPYIALTTMDAPPALHASVGNSMHPYVYPMTETGYIFPLPFKKRVLSTLYTLGVMKAFEYFVAPVATAQYRNLLGDNYPDSIVFERNASMIFMNANPIFYPPRPVTPNTINLEGGLHLKEPKELPQDLQTYLDESKHGCIYFSLGSTVDSNALNLTVIEIFRKTFEDLAPMRVLWKFQNETLPNKPKNLEIRKWLPQQDILRHPNIKLFITQGGLQSMEEAIDSAVPMLGMPFFGDQIHNVNIMVKKQFGLRLDVKTMDQKALKDAIQELLKNPLYRKNVQKLSKIQKDKPMNALEKAVWWTEYVLRHGDTSHLRSPSADIPLYQYFFLDILAFLLVVFIFICLICYYSFKLIRFLFRKIFKSKSTKNKEKVN